jgi:hypothetical protein
MKTLIAILAVLLAVPAFAADQVPTDIAVINAVLKLHEQSLNGKYVVVKKTTGDLQPTFTDAVVRTIGDELGKQLIADYKTRNAAPIELSFGVDVPKAKTGGYDFTKVKGNYVIEVSRPGLGAAETAAVVRLTEFAKEGLPRPFSYQVRRDVSTGEWNAEILSGPLF